MTKGNEIAALVPACLLARSKARGRAVVCACAALALATACQGGPSDALLDGSGDESGDTTTTNDGGDTTTTGGDPVEDVPYEVNVRVTQDGVAKEGATVMQAGSAIQQLTDALGEAVVAIDIAIPGDRMVVASSVNARSKGADAPVLEDGDVIEVALTTIVVGDNEAYTFEDPGTPSDNGTTAKCAHCHPSQVNDWVRSPHRTSALNPVVQDVYAGTSAAITTAAACTTVGGTWAAGIGPGAVPGVSRCYLGGGTLPDLNPTCVGGVACELDATAFGACADCHAPGIDGVLGGRSLLEAEGFAYDYGVHCDVCHKVESLDLSAPAGVAGRLRIQRPLEGPSGTFEWLPLTFGPFVDVINPRMGATARDHFQQPEFCAGCHELMQEVLVPGASIDTTRWPDGTLPIHTTFSEWQNGPFAGVAPCISCHMPPDAEAGNGADIPDPENASITFGWMRPQGSIRRHQWGGPRQPETGLLDVAGAVFIDHAVDAGALTANVTVKNVGPGHALPTGEPLRSMVMYVRARCGADAQPAVGGDVVAPFSGALDQRTSADDWNTWPGASVGDVVRVLQSTGGHHDYVGYGPFGDGTFDAAQKGMLAWDYVGQSTVISVNGDQVAFDAPLPAGDLALRGVVVAFGADHDTPLPTAGAPGFAFARVLADVSGEVMVPHHRAVDVVSDNRILPQQSWTSTHRFVVTCADPVVDVELVHRAWTPSLGASRGWSGGETLMEASTK